MIHRRLRRSSNVAGEGGRTFLSSCSVPIIITALSLHSQTAILRLFWLGHKRQARKIFPTGNGNLLPGHLRLGRAIIQVETGTGDNGLPFKLLFPPLETCFSPTTSYDHKPLRCAYPVLISNDLMPPPCYKYRPSQRVIDKGGRENPCVA